MAINSTKNADRTDSRHRADERKCEKAIKQTLAYRGVFKYPMSFYQICTFLLSDKKFDHQLISSQLSKLVKNHELKVKGGKYFINKIKPVSWHLRAKYSKEYVKKARLTTDLLKVIPWIKLCAITGSVSAYNATSADDIDLCFVCSKNRIWITRLLVVLILKLTHMYRTDTNFNGKICPNIYIDAAQLQWKPAKQNVYVANEILMMHPVINRENMYFRFLSSNSWMDKYFANALAQKDALETKDLKYPKSTILNTLENMLFTIQKIYMHKKQTTEETNKKLIHFNKDDSTSFVLSQFEMLSKDY